MKAYRKSSIFIRGIMLVMLVLGILIAPLGNVGSIQAETGGNTEVQKKEVATSEVATEQVIEDQVTEDQVIEDQVAEDQVAEDQVTEDQVAEDQVVEEQVVEITEPNTQDGVGSKKTNLVKDPSFESFNTPGKTEYHESESPYWKSRATDGQNIGTTFLTLPYPSNKAHSGSQAMRFYHPTHNSPYMITLEQNVALEAGKTYVLDYWVNVETAPYSGVQILYGYTYIWGTTTWGATNNTWVHKVTDPFTVKEGDAATQGPLRIAPAGDIYVSAYLDDVSITEVGAPDTTVTFNANGGSAPTPASKTVTNGEAYGTLATVTPPAGKKFDGWYTAATGGTKVNATTIVTNSADHTLYAHYTSYPSVHVITEKYVDENNQPISGQANTTKLVSNAANYTKTPPTIAGYSYQKYQVDDGGFRTGNPSITNVTGAHTVTMKYKKIDYLIYSKLQTGTNNPVYNIDRTTTSHYTNQIAIGTTASQLLTNLYANTSDSLRVVKSDGITSVAGTTVVGTGMKVQNIVGGNVVDSITLVLYGDVTGDGKVNLSDLNIVSNHAVGVATITNPDFLEAADVNHDGSIGIADVNIISNHVFSGIPISQII